MSAIYSVCGRDFASTLIPVEGELAGIKVSGFTCKPTACRPKRNAQFVFLNGRYVRSGTVASALEAAYKNMTMVGRYPAAVLHLTVPYGAVDINVHPAKTEVRFSDERRIFDCVMFSIKNALAKGDSRPEMNLQKGHGQIRMTADEYRQTVLPGVEKAKSDPLNAYAKMLSEQSKKNAPLSPSSVGGGYRYEVPVVKKPAEETKQSYFPWEETKNNDTASKQTAVDIEDIEFGETNPVEAEVKTESEVVKAVETVSYEPILENVVEVKEVEVRAETEPQFEMDIEYIGEAFSTYIIVRKGESLYLIDKHAAHERILFNKLKSEAKNHPQILLSPEQVTLTKDEYTVITENLELLEKAGFEMDDYGDGTVLVRTVPSTLAGENVSSLVSELAANLSEKATVEVERLERIYETVSCRSAIKAGNLSSVEELIELAKTVLGSKEIMYCPHGRPVAIELTKREIEKQFGRIQ